MILLLSHQIVLSIDGNSDGATTTLATIDFDEYGTGSGSYNAVKMKDRIEDVLAQFESGGLGNLIMRMCWSSSLGWIR